MQLRGSVVVHKFLDPAFCGYGEGCHRIGKPLAAGIRQPGGLAKVQTLCEAFGHTGRFKPHIQPIFAVVTLYSLVCHGVPLDGSPGAGHNAALASNTGGGFYEDDPVGAAFFYGPGWAYLETPGFLTVKTGHKDKPD